MTFTPGDEAPDVLYYYSGASANMGGIMSSLRNGKIFSNMNDLNLYSVQTRDFKCAQCFPGFELNPLWRSCSRVERLRI